MPSRRKITTTAAGVATPSLWLAAARAADAYPAKLITLMVPQAPGEANDMTGRTRLTGLGIESLGCAA